MAAEELTQEGPVRYDNWLLWPDDDDHRIRMENDTSFKHNPLARSRMEHDMFRRFNRNLLRSTPTLRSIPRFVATHMDGSQGSFNNGHMLRGHLKQFLTLQYGHTYRIYIRNESPYCRGLPSSIRYYINAVFVHYVYRNSVPHAKMFVVETNLPMTSSWLPRRIIGVNELHIFDIRDFSDWYAPADITPPDSLAQFKQMRMDSSGAVNKMVMDAISNERTSTNTYFPVPHYLHRLTNFGGKKSKTRKRKR